MSERELLERMLRRGPYSARVLRRGLGISSGELLALLRELGARQVSVACILLDLYMRRRAERVMGRRRGSRQRVWSYRLVGAVPEHLL